MPYILTVLAAFAISRPALADLAPDPLDPSGPTGALVWIAAVAAIGALALIWFRRRR